METGKEKEKTVWGRGGEKMRKRMIEMRRRRRSSRWSKMSKKRSKRKSRNRSSSSRRRRREEVGGSLSPQEPWGRQCGQSAERSQMGKRGGGGWSKGSRIRRWSRNGKMKKEEQKYQD